MDPRKRLIEGSETKWRIIRGKSGCIVASCDDVGITLEAQTHEELLSLVTEAVVLLMEDRDVITVPLFSKAFLREMWNMWCRYKAHAAFDHMWQSGEMSRNAAYRWLASELGMSRDDCHMSLFDAAMCRRVVEACRRRNE